MSHHRVEACVVRAGRPVLVSDDADRENEMDFVLAAEAYTDEQMAFVLRHTSGFVCGAFGSEAKTCRRLSFATRGRNTRRGTTSKEVPSPANPPTRGRRPTRAAGFTTQRASSSRTYARCAAACLHCGYASGVLRIFFSPKSFDHRKKGSMSPNPRFILKCGGTSKGGIFVVV